MPARVLDVDFAGSFSWPGTPSAPSLSDADIAGRCGIYLWTVALEEGELIYYVGMTARSFRDRRCTS